MKVRSILKAFLTCFFPQLWGSSIMWMVVISSCFGLKPLIALSTSSIPLDCLSLNVLLVLYSLYRLQLSADGGREPGCYCSDSLLCHNLLDCCIETVFFSSPLHLYCVASLLVEAINNKERQWGGWEDTGRTVKETEQFKIGRFIGFLWSKNPALSRKML